MLFVSILSLSLSVAADAAPKTIYVIDAKTLSTEEALIASLKGKAVLGCKEVQATPNASGTSVSLKAVK